jgi:hypothetical protein
MASRRPPRPLIFPLPPSQFKAELELPLSPFALASHLHTQPEHRLHPAPPLSSPPPPGKLIAGEELPLLSISSSLMFLLVLIEPTVPQAQVLDVLRSCALITPERRRPAVVELGRRRLIFVCELTRLLSRGEQKPPRSFFSISCAQQRLHGLAGEADPHPSGAGRRGRPQLALDLLGVCACFLSSSRALHARNGALWANLGHAGDSPAKRRRATSVSGARAAIPRTHTSKTV